MIALNAEIINRQDGNVEIKVSFYAGKRINFVPVRYMVMVINAFYHDVDDLKKATILWSVAHWGQYEVCRTNDNAFVFNRMLCYNTALYDNKHNKWEFDRVNDLSAT